MTKLHRQIEVVAVLYPQVLGERIVVVTERIDPACRVLAEHYLPTDVPECQDLAVAIHMFVDEWLTCESNKAAKAEVAKVLAKGS